MKAVGLSHSLYGIGQPVILDVDIEVLRQPRIEQAGPHAGLQHLEVLIRGDDRWELLVIAMVDQLIELLASPWSRMLCSQIVQNEQVGTPDLLEPVVISNAARWVERRSKLIEEVWYHAKINASLTSRHDVVGDRGREMRFPDSAVAVEKEPARRVPGIIERGFVGVPKPRCRLVECLKRQLCQ
jgi:hypothetical protein